MSDDEAAIDVSVDPPNGRSPYRVVKLAFGGRAHVDTIDPLSGYHRMKLLDRAAVALAVERCRLADVEQVIVAQAERGEGKLAGPIVYPALTGAELDAEQYALDYLIEGVLARGQHTIGGGPHKSLKTLILACDLGLSLAHGGMFLGYFKVPSPTRTAIMSGECGFPVLQEYLRRVARAAGTELRYVGNLLVSETLPKFGHLDHVEAMRKFIADNGLHVVILDPAYLAMPGDDAGNVFLMGSLLRSMGDLFVELRATLILLHHTTKPAGIDGAPIDLGHLSFAGFREFAAQWLLLSRRQPYQPGTGHHELWLSAGGRAGHSGLWGLDVDEGQYQPGAERQWEVTVKPADNARNQAEQRQAALREERKEATRKACLDRAKRKVVDVLVKYPAGETPRTVRDRVGLDAAQFRDALSELITEGMVVPCEVVKTCRKTPYEGYKLAD